MGHGSRGMEPSPPMPGDCPSCSMPRTPWCPPIPCLHAVPCVVPLVPYLHPPLHDHPTPNPYPSCLMSPHLNEQLQLLVVHRHHPLRNCLVQHLVPPPVGPCSQGGLRRSGLGLGLKG